MSESPLAELRRIESDPAYRARFRALLDAALARQAAVDAVRALRGLLESRTAEKTSALAVTLGAVAWTVRRGPGRDHVSGACGACGALSAVHLAALAQWRGALHQVLGAGPELRCSLELHTGPHMDVLHEGPDPGSAIWARWAGADGAADVVLLLPDCPVGGGGEGCGQYASHPGRHTWQVEDPAPASRSASRGPRWPRPRPAGPVLPAPRRPAG